MKMDEMYENECMMGLGWQVMMCVCVSVCVRNRL